MNYPRDYSWVFAIDDPELKFEVIRELAKRDLYFLCRYVLGYQDLETKTDIHYRLCAELDENPQRYIILIPRGFFKTSIMIGKCIQWIINDPAVQIGIGSDKIDRAEKRTRDLRDVISGNELLKSLFPEVFYAKPENQADLWTFGEFNVKRPSRTDMAGGFRHPTVSAFGLDPKPTGSHYTHVWIDDVENDENMANDEQIDKLNRNLAGFFPVLKPEAPLIITGTIYSQHGPNLNYAGKPGWRVYRRAVRDKYGQPTFPTKFPESFLRQIQSDINDQYIWAGQYELRASERTDLYLYPFKRVSVKTVYVDEWRIYHAEEVIERKNTLVYITVDPSGGASRLTATSKSDRVGVAVNAVDLAGRWHILDWFKEYYDDQEFVDLLFRLYDKWHPYTIGIEKTPHLNTILRIEFVRRGRSLPISELKPKGRAKEERIRALNPLWENIYFNDRLPEVQKIIHTWYTKMEHGDDDLDALAYQIDIARPPTKEQLKLRQQQIEQEEEELRFKSLPLLEQQEWQHVRQVLDNNSMDLTFVRELEEFVQ